MLSPTDPLNDMIESQVDSCRNLCFICRKPIPPGRFLCGGKECRRQYDHRQRVSFASRERKIYLRTTSHYLSDIENI